MTKCAVCRAVWVCTGRCEVTHWRMCFHIQWGKIDCECCDADDDEFSLSSSTVESSQKTTVDTISLTTSYDGSESLPGGTRDIVEHLTDIVFGISEKPSLGHQVDWRFLDAEQDLPALIQLVLVEFHTSFRKAIGDARKMSKGTIDTPHVLDLFAMEQCLSRNNISLAICVRNEQADGMLMWLDGDGNYYPITPPFHLSRVASLSGTCRILESLSMPPSLLMNSALARSANMFVDATEIEIDLLNISQKCNTYSLNKTQKQAVAMVESASFKDGFFLVHGPPGSGKTMVSSAAEVYVPRLEFVSQCTGPCIFCSIDTDIGGNGSIHWRSHSDSSVQRRCRKHRYQGPSSPH